jgi:hypothetical protein
MQVILYSPKYPKGQVFTTDTDVEIALTQGFVRRKEDIYKGLIARNVPEKAEEGSKLCACGCGTPTRKTWAPGHYAKHQKALREKGNGGH